MEEFRIKQLLLERSPVPQNLEIDHTWGIGQNRRASVHPQVLEPGVFNQMDYNSNTRLLGDDLRYHTAGLRRTGRVRINEKDERYSPQSKDSLF